MSLGSVLMAAEATTPSWRGDFRLLLHQVAVVELLFAVASTSAGTISNDVLITYQLLPSLPLGQVRVS